MVLIPNNQTFSPAASGIIVTGLLPVFRAQIDTVLLGGRDITLNLPPARQPCPLACKFNSSYGKFIGTAGALCRGCAGQGFVFEPRQTIYRANIRHTDEPLPQTRGGGEDTPGGRVFEALVRTKTVIESYDHILEAVSADIDGIKYTLWNDPRQTGWGDTLLYVVTFWKKVNKRLTNG